MDRPSNFPSIFRKPVRVTITLPHNIYMHLKHRSDEEGRSLSNLAAFLLEKSLDS
ncbi:MAG: ribbon-helix-helix domain-containing protein [Cyanobium sp.]